MDFGVVIYSSAMIGTLDMALSHERIFLKVWPAAAVLALLVFNIGWLPADGATHGSDFARPAFTEPAPLHATPRSAMPMPQAEKRISQIRTENSDLNAIYFWPALFEVFRNPDFDPAPVRQDNMRQDNMRQDDMRDDNMRQNNTRKDNMHQVNSPAPDNTGKPAGSGTYPPLKPAPEPDMQRRACGEGSKMAVDRDIQEIRFACSELNNSRGHVPWSDLAFLASGYRARS